MSSGCARTATAIWSSAGNAARRFDPHLVDCPRDPVAPDGPCAQGGRGGRGRGAALLLLRGAGEAFRALPRASPRASKRVSSASSTTASSARAPASGSTMSGSGSARIKEKSRGVGAHYVIDVIADDRRKEGPAPSLGERRPLAGTMITPSRRLLPAHQRRGLGRGDVVADTYTALTDVEAVFRSLKSELGHAPHLPPDPEALRRAPVHHR